MTSRRFVYSALIALVVFTSVSALSIPTKIFSQEKKCEVKNSPKEKEKTGKEFKDGAPCGDGLGKCKNDKCEIQGDGKMPMLPMLPMLPMPMPMPPPPPSDSNCNSGTGAGGIVRNESATTSTTTKDQNCQGSNNPYWDATGSSIQPNVSQNINDNTSKTEKTATQNVSDLFHDLFGDTGTDFTSNNGSSSTNVVKPTPASTSTPRANPYVGNPGIIEINPGVSGNIEFHDRGATIHITRESGGTTVAGFYGSDTVTQPVGLVQGWCASRPWANNFLSRIIPTGFFDGLCTLRGYAVGIVHTAPNSSRAPAVSVPRQQPTVSTFTSNPIIQPAPKPKPPPASGHADIWAVPSSVRLGSRATVFWNASGVTSCEETSPEGGFTHSTISGGAETVAISGPSTFVITCMTQGGTRISNYTTINLAN